ncbi:MAG TPA: YjbF family lipoprotein [Chthoniobacterales bacterium]|nr:YjbF family lipoprotein [Chthoniobacterales bacterium]
MMPKKSSGLSRRAVFLAGATLPLAGCEMPYGFDFNTVKTSLAVSTGLEDAPGITLEQASQIPYASIGYRIGSSQEYILVLASTIADALLWTAADHRALVTQNGRVTRSAGFDWNLGETSFAQVDPVAIGLQKMSANVVLTRTLDLRDIDRFGIAVQSTFTPAGKTSISVLGANLDVVEVHEDCRCDVLDWAFQNIFWADASSGFVWRSVQTIHPNLPPLTIEVLRPPG